MDELIFKKALLDDIENNIVFTVREGRQYQKMEGAKMVVERVEKAPSVDPVHAAGGCYCRECVRGRQLEDEELAKFEYPLGYILCKPRCECVPPDGFCSMGYGLNGRG